MHSVEYEHEILQFVSEHILLNNDYLDEIHKYYDYGLIQIQTILDHVYSFIEVERIKHYSECFDELIVYEKNFMQHSKLQLNTTNGIIEQWLEEVELFIVILMQHYYDHLIHQEHLSQIIRKWISYEEMKVYIENHSHLIANYDGITHEQCEINLLLKVVDGYYLIYKHITIKRKQYIKVNKKTPQWCLSFL